MTEVFVYKIMEPGGLFSSGGVSYPTWTLKGKIWPSPQAVKQHLLLFEPHHPRGTRWSDFYKDAVVVVFKLVMMKKRPIHQIQLEAFRDRESRRKINEAKHERRSRP